MLFRRFRDFLADEDGSYTAWFLTWFALFFAFGGFAVDVSDAFRVESQLQATADAAALAGSMSLPDEGAAVNQALMVAQGNMPITLNGEPFNGNVAKPSEIIIGHWDIDNKRFVTDGTPRNAVYVATRRGDANENPLSPAFLRVLGIMGFRNFDLATVAVAVQHTSKCLGENGLVAGNKIDITSGNNVHSLCIHANNEIVNNGHDNAIEFNSNNDFTGSRLSNPAGMDGLPHRSNMCTKNEPVCEEGVVERGWMEMAESNDLSASMIDGMADLNSPYLPDHLFMLDGNGEFLYNLLTGKRILKSAGLVHQKDESFTGPFLPYNVYKINCANNKTFKLPNGAQVINTAIIASCGIQGASGGTIMGSLLASTAIGNGQDKIGREAISLANGWTVGNPLFCTVPGTPDVRIYSASSAKIVAQTNINGLHAVVKGDFQLTAGADVNGVSVMAARDITATAGGDYNYCDQTFDVPLALRHRLAF